MAELVTCRKCKHNTLHEEDVEQYHWCEIDNDNYDVSEPRECAAYMAATNSDVLRAMTDEELAYLFAGGECGYCHLKEKCFSMEPIRDCEDMWLDWLKSPVEVDDAD